MSVKVNITSKGIQKVLKNYNEKQAIAEYIWNGFDANADTIEIDYVANALGLLESLTIADNGYGINFERLQQKFDPFYESEKSLQIVAPKHTSKMHGRNGVGRLTFFTFAHDATWQTTYQSEQGFRYGEINISTGGLNSYSHDFTAKPTITGNTGTTVSFTNLRIGEQEMKELVLPYLINEFCWFIELNKHKNYLIIVNGETLDFSSNVRTLEEFNLFYPDTSVTFKIKYVHWKENLHKELSKYYFLAGGEEIYKDYTTLNKKSDDYFHSIYIDSDFFRDFDFKSFENEGQVAIFGAAKSSPEYRFLIKELTVYLKEKRKPFLKEYASRLIETYEQDEIFPVYANESEKQLKKPALINLIKALYEIEPKLFSSLNTDQKKTLVRLIDLLLHSNQHVQLFELFNGLMELETEEYDELALLLLNKSLVS
ncbi:ATP-binding protein [Pedobacter jeongneungensis]|uniref:ATP-binding protein n=1 Tax=Pedobacter jeongneungensis TaxID=947309 RepID=UPI0004695A54|nr:ATP-binding protein [Pedobacter jeongneungensis]